MKSIFVAVLLVQLIYAEPLRHTRNHGDSMYTESEQTRQVEKVYPDYGDSMMQSHTQHRRNDIDTSEMSQAITQVGQQTMNGYEQIGKFIKDQAYSVYNYFSKPNSKRMDTGPKFNDILQLGNINETYQLANMYFTEVQVQGLNEYEDKSLEIDTDNRKVNALLQYDLLNITGFYRMKNVIKSASGRFTIVLRNVTYKEYDTYAVYGANFVNILTSSFVMSFESIESDYENIGLLASLLKSQINKKFGKDVLRQVGQEITYRLRPRVLWQITLKEVKETEVPTGSDNDAQFIQSLRSVISETYRLLSVSGTPVKEWENTSQEYKDDNYTVRSSGLTLQSFSMQNASIDVQTNKTEEGDTDLYVRAAFGPLKLTTVITVESFENSADLHIPFGVEKVQFEVEASVSSGGNSGVMFNLYSTKTSVYGLSFEYINDISEEIKQLLDNILPSLLEQVTKSSFEEWLHQGYQQFSNGEKQFQIKKADSRKRSAHRNHKHRLTL